MRKVNTLRFGDIEVDEKKIVHFDEGIPAFEDEHEFLIVPYDEESPYVFLQSLNTPDLAFLMTSPFVFFNDYQFEIDDDTLNRLGIISQDQLLIYTLISIPGNSIENMTTNLMAPIVINAETMSARQVILEKSGYTTKHRLFPEKEK